MHETNPIQSSLGLRRKNTKSSPSRVNFSGVASYLMINKKNNRLFISDKSVNMYIYREEYIPAYA